MLSPQLNEVTFIISCKSGNYGFINFFGIYSALLKYIHLMLDQQYRFPTKNKSKESDYYQ